MTCPVCGATLPADAIFCGVCGSAVGTREEREAEHSARPAAATSAPPIAYVPTAAPATAVVADGDDFFDDDQAGGSDGAAEVDAGEADDADQTAAVPPVVAAEASARASAEAPPGAPPTAPSATAAGAPGSAPATAPSPAPLDARPLAPEELTRLPAAVPRPATTRFVLVFSTGEHVVVEGTGLIGRRPQAQPGESFDTLV
ncbi:MAG TPA: zinc ribbon domain-containing protein, partial [Naasia sp.]